MSTEPGTTADAVDVFLSVATKPKSWAAVELHSYLCADPTVGRLYDLLRAGGASCVLMLREALGEPDGGELFIPPPLPPGMGPDEATMVWFVCALVNDDTRGAWDAIQAHEDGHGVPGLMRVLASLVVMFRTFNKEGGAL